MYKVQREKYDQNLQSSPPHGQIALLVHLQEGINNKGANLNVKGLNTGYRDNKHIFSSLYF